MLGVGHVLLQSMLLRAECLSSARERATAPPSPMILPEETFNLMMATISRHIAHGMECRGTRINTLRTHDGIIRRTVEIDALQ
jgi:hypothetical protein